MSIILRQITRRATGGEIVRERELAEGAVRIGRGADCEVRIPDLAVSLHHATLSLDGGKVRIDAAGDQPFGVDGKFVHSATVKPADNAVLTFGDHRMVVGGDAGRIILTLTRFEAEASPGQPDADATGFAPKRQILSKRRLAWAGFGTIALLCLIVPVLFFTGVFDSNLLHPKIDVDAQWSSGPLSQAHAFLEDDCQACHQKAFVSVRDETCKACHSAAQTPAILQRTNARVRAGGSPETASLIADHAPPSRLMWGAPPPSGLGQQVIAFARKTFNRPEQSCETCHVEHVGNPLIDPARPKPTLQETETCTGCHTDLNRRLKDTSLRNAPSWPRHPELTPRITLSAAPLQVRRVSMADRPRENSGLTFPHALHLATGNSVARMAQTIGKSGAGGALDCASCHVATPNGAGFKPVEMESACSSCHSLGFATAGGVRQMPHGDVGRLVSFLSSSGPPVTGARPQTPRRRPGEAVAARSGGRGVAPGAVQRMRGAFSPGGSCYDCHTVSSGDDGYAIGAVHLADAWLTRGAFDHRTKEHRLDRDGQPNCGTCHNAAQSSDARDVMLPRLATCQTCHGKPQTPTTNPASVSAPANCSTCHSYHAPARPVPVAPGGRREPSIMDDRVPARRGRVTGRRRSKTPVR